MEQSIDYYNEQIRKYRELCTAQPTNQTYRDELMEAYVAAAEIYEYESQDEVIRYYKELADFLAGLLQALPEDGHLMSDLTVAYEYLADFYLEWHVRDKAFESYRKSLCLKRKLYAGDSNNVSYITDLFVLLSKMGREEMVMGHVRDAIGYYQEARGLMCELLVVSPEDVDAHQFLIHTSTDVAEQFLSTREIGLADLAADAGDCIVEYYRQEMVVAQKLCDKHPENGVYAENLVNTQLSLEKLKA